MVIILVLYNTDKNIIINIIKISLKMVLFFGFIKIYSFIEQFHDALICIKNK